ncbi:MAG: histidine--tRNA ligase [Acidobacteria bacterium]|nr:histidine--tRNA ligase [Acidobacteriota bacterium]
MIPAIRGTHDILPGEIERWQRAEQVVRDVCERYGYREIRTPVIEREELFAKGTGETTDIVQKEMYAFEDKGGERVTLRPEATPSMVRAFVEHALEQRLPTVKIFSLGPMFRYERPQKGRYRQFHQLDVEVFGVTDATLDAEVVEMAAALVDALGIDDAEVVVNSVGCAECRPGFSRALLAALGDRAADLCGDCRRRAALNPLRIFDCKVPSCQPIVDTLPHATDYLCDACRSHFEATTGLLKALDVDFRVSHRLVRGLDYYTRTTFEIRGGRLGAQNALLGGGRYDGLVRQLGGPDRAGIGFAAGMERLVLAMPDGPGPRAPDAFIVALGEAARQPAHRLARDLRRAALTVLIDYGDRSMKAQLRRANRTCARHVLILGEDELAQGNVTVKDMTSGGETLVGRDDVVRTLTADAVPGPAERAARERRLKAVPDDRPGGGPEDAERPARERGLGGPKPTV